MSIDEGVIKFNQRLELTGPLTNTCIESINAIRVQLYALKLIGEYPDIKIGYGNISQRTTRNHSQAHPFIISGSQTGHLPVLDGRHYCHVMDFDLANNSLQAKGPIQASSESLTHAAIYECNTQIAGVIHIHNREIWQGMIQDDLPHTPANIPYGTLAMAQAVKNVVSLATNGWLAMAGHEDGVICYGKNLQQAFALCQDLYERYSSAALLKN